MQVPSNAWETFLLAASAGDAAVGAARRAIWHSGAPVHVSARRWTPAAVTTTRVRSPCCAQGMWFVLSPQVLKASALLLGLSWASSSGEGFLPGPAALALLLLVAGCLSTEVIKFAQGMQVGGLAGGCAPDGHMC
jgi:hypothetical protein